MAYSNLIKTTADYLTRALPVVVIIISALVVFDSDHLDINRRKPGYDETHWTSAGIATYAMFTGHQRKDIKDDPGWFVKYAYKHELDIFKPGANNTPVVDYSKISPKEYQWFDFTLWTFGWKAPNLSKLMKGAYINLRADHVDPNGYYELGRAEEEENPQLYYGRPPAQFIEYARHTDAMFCFFSLLLVFFIGRRFFHPMVGVVAWLYLLLNASFIRINTASGMDSSLFCFSMASILSLLYLVEEVRKDKPAIKRVIISAGALGLSLGLAVSSKFNGATLFYSVLVVVPALLYTIWRRYPKLPSVMAGKKKVKYADRIKLKNERKKFIPLWLKTITIASGVIFIVSSSVFLYLNPQLRNNPSKKVAIIRNSVEDYFENRARILKTAYIQNSLKESLKLVINKNYFYTGSGTIKQFTGTLGRLIDTKWKFLDALFLIIGIAIAAKRSWRSLKVKGITDSYFVVLAFFIVISYMNTNFIWIEFDRYFMPFHIAGSLLIAIGITTSVNYLSAVIRSRVSSPSPG